MNTIKKRFVRYALSILIVLFAAFSMNTPANAGLLITPLQVTMEDRSRVTEITLVNSSKDTNTYRLSWSQLEQVENVGGYIKIEEENRKGRRDLQDFAVFTPRQITLRPNERQTIRVAVRRPNDLEDGEYKSHIKFSIVPSLTVKQDLDKDVSDDEIGIGAKVYASYSILCCLSCREIMMQSLISAPQSSL